MIGKTYGVVSPEIMKSYDGLGFLKAIVDGTLGRWLTEDYRATHDIAWLREMFVGVSDEGYASCCSIIEHMSLSANLAQIRAPTLVIGGAQDPATPPAEHAAKIAEAIVGARLEILDPGAVLDQTAVRPAAAPVAQAPVAAAPATEEKPATKSPAANLCTRPTWRISPAFPTASWAPN